MTEYVYATWQGAIATALATVMHEREERMTTPTAPDLREALTAAFNGYVMRNDLKLVVDAALSVLEPALAAERERVVGLVRSCRPRQPLQPMPATMAAAAMKCDEIEELIRALPPSAPADPWRPIETAPKDGTPILVARAGDSVGVDVEITEWCVIRRSHMEHVEGELYRKIEDAPDEFWNGNGHRATHWMPLPPPPSARDR